MSRHMWWTVTVLVALTLSLVVAGCTRSQEAVRRAADLNVLLITIDTLRADAVGAYGRPGATPWIDRLSAAGVRFDEARAHNVMTLPSHASILSGRLPPEHGIRDNAGFRFPATMETLTTLLKARGYRTGAFVSAFPLESRFGLARGFDVYDDGFADAAPRPAFLVQERRGEDTVTAARQWIESAGNARWFCWVHLYEPHFPYEPPQHLAARFPNDAYRGEVAAADAALAPLLGPIVELGEGGRTLVVLTSDHGEALGDHGEATHGVFAYEPVLKVPLVLYQPRIFEPAVVTNPAGHVDLLPTILDALSMPVPDGLAGRSLLQAIAGVPDRDPAPTYFEALSPSLNRRWAPLYGVVRDRTKYIDLPIPELYDLAADPREANNIAGSQPQLVAELRDLVAR
ncbi:MAG: sulfatase, partial [Vicinamibacterales bacterium]